MSFNLRNLDEFVEQELFIEPESGVRLQGNYPEFNFEKRKRTIVLDFNAFSPEPLCQLSPLAELDNGFINEHYVSAWHAYANKMFDTLVDNPFMQKQKIGATLEKTFKNEYTRARDFIFELVKLTSQNGEYKLPITQYNRFTDDVVKALFPPRADPSDVKHKIVANKLSGFFPMLATYIAYSTTFQKDVFMDHFGLKLLKDANQTCPHLEVVWLKILREKFKNETMRTVLMNTQGAYLVYRTTSNIPGFYTALFNSDFTKEEQTIWANRILKSDDDRDGVYAEEDNNIPFYNFKFNGKVSKDVNKPYRNAMGKFLMLIRSELFIESSLATMTKSTFVGRRFLQAATRSLIEANTLAEMINGEKVALDSRLVNYSAMQKTYEERTTSSVLYKTTENELFFDFCKELFFKMVKRPVGTIDLQRPRNGFKQQEYFDIWTLNYYGIRFSEVVKKHILQQFKPIFVPSMEDFSDSMVTLYNKINQFRRKALTLHIFNKYHKIGDATDQFIKDVEKALSISGRELDDTMFTKENQIMLDYFFTKTYKVRWTGEEFKNASDSFVENYYSIDKPRVTRLLKGIEAGYVQQYNFHKTKTRLCYSVSPPKGTRKMKRTYDNYDESQSF